MTNSAQPFANLPQAEKESLVDAVVKTSEIHLANETEMFRKGVRWSKTNDANGNRQVDVVSYQTAKVPDVNGDNKLTLLGEAVSTGSVDDFLNNLLGELVRQGITILDGNSMSSLTKEFVAKHNIVKTGAALSLPVANRSDAPLRAELFVVKLSKLWTGEKTERSVKSVKLKSIESIAMATARIFAPMLNIGDAENHKLCLARSMHTNTIDRPNDIDLFFATKHTIKTPSGQEIVTGVVDSFDIGKFNTFVKDANDKAKHRRIESGQAKDAKDAKAQTASVTPSAPQAEDDTNAALGVKPETEYNAHSGKQNHHGQFGQKHGKHNRR